MNYVAGVFIGAVTYQTLVDFRLKHLEHEKGHLRDQLKIHEEVKTNRIKLAVDPKSPLAIKTNEYFKPNGQFDHDSPIDYHGKNLLPYDAKEQINQLQGKTNYWKERSLFPFLREPDTIVTAISGVFPKIRNE